MEYGHKTAYSIEFIQESLHGDSPYYNSLCYFLRVQNTSARNNDNIMVLEKDSLYNYTESQYKQL